MTLPTFEYHPDPIATGSVVPSSTECECCGKSRGFIYTGPVYADDEYQDCICPWCIADGSANTKLGATFTDEEGVGGGGEWCSVDGAIAEELACRTPGFSGWQQEQWWTHCNDAGQYVGRMGKEDLITLGPQAIEAIQDSAGMKNGPQWEEFFAALTKNGSPTAYIFRCRHCRTLGGYQDCD